MATTGNVKISELNAISNLSGEAIFPISYSISNNGLYESYSVTAENIKDYIDSELDISEKISSYLETSTTAISEWHRDSARIDESSTTTLSVAISGKYVNSYGGTTSKSGYYISSYFNAYEGTLYILPISATVPDDCATFAKYDTSYILYRGVTYTSYEPVSIYYSDSAFGLPDDEYAVWLCDENCKAVISGTSFSSLIGIKYGLFADIAKNWLNVTSERSKVISQNIAYLNARLDAIEERTSKLGDLECDTLSIYNEYPKVMGDYTVKLLDRPLSSSSYYSTAIAYMTDVPNMLGQIVIAPVAYHSSSYSAYIALGNTSSFSNWARITTTTF